METPAPGVCGVVSTPCLPGVFLSFDGVEKGGGFGSGARSTDTSSIQFFAVRPRTSSACVAVVLHGMTPWVCGVSPRIESHAW